VFTPASAAARAGRRAGVAVQEGALINDAAYAAIVTGLFNAVTPENATKWGPLQPESPNRWNFDGADSIVDFADDAQLDIKGHTLIWHQQLPPFVDASTPKKKLEQYMEKHIERTVNRYRRDMFAWDVVNEAIADDGSGLRPSPFSNAFGEAFIDRAFKLAQQADRDAELYYNDYGIEGPGAKSDAVYALMQRLIARRVPIDGIGFQGHLDARFAPSYDALVANFERFAALGLSLNVSELDVQVADVGGSRAYRLAVQKQIYQRVAAACAAVEACDGITVWGISDAYSWIDSTFGPDDPLLLDDNNQKKPAYFGFVDGFLGVPLDAASLEPNLVGNSSLEAGLDGWSPQGPVQLSTETESAHTGLRSVRASGRADTWQGPRFDVSALVAPERSYDVSVWASVDGAASADVRLTAQVACAGAADQFLPIGSATATSGGWVELAGSVTVPACDGQSVALYVEGPAAGVDILVDDLALREQPLPNLIPNGDFESGTAGWFPFGPTTIGTTSESHGGSQAAIVSGRTDTWQGIAMDITSRVAARGAYRAEAYIKVDAPSAPVRLTAAITCAGQPQSFVSIGGATADDSDFVRVSGTLNVPNCSLTSVVMYAEGPAAGVSMIVDDVAMWQLPTPEQPNVIGNSGFESGTGGWFGFGPVTLESTPDRAHGGTRSARATGRTDSWQGIATSLVGALTPGASYSVRAFVQVGTGSNQLNLTFQNQCDGGAQNFTWVTGAVAGSGAWTELTGTLVAPSCTLTTGNLYVEGAPAGVDIYLDDVEVKLVP
jgi:GH35 family endo-1,4-beta-xylanase